MEQHEKNKSRSDILKMGKLLKLTAMFIKRTLDRYEETNSTKDSLRTGRPRCQRTKKGIKAVREKINRNPRRSMRQMAKEHQMSPMTMHRLQK